MPVPPTEKVWRVLNGTTLELGPYIGAPTEHTQIEMGVGVCGTAVARDEDMNVPDVTTTENYLACSVETKSELVVLIRSQDGRILGQIDIDSHERAAFGPAPVPVSTVDSTVLRVLAISDLHGQLEPRVWDWSQGRQVGGVAAMRPWLDSLARACGCTAAHAEWVRITGVFDCAINSRDVASEAMARGWQRHALFQSVIVHRNMRGQPLCIIR